MFTPRGHCRTFMILGLTFSASVAQAQVTLDGTLGPAGPLSGPNYAIPAEVGQQHGGNLFHSFGQFSIQQGESATFSGPNSVNNIIGRVTGGQVSTIDGLLRSTIPGANLYLLNPAGLLFGPNAALDVSGSFHASTADYLRLGEGGRFEALTPGTSVLTVAPVEAFGFLGDAPGRIDIRGSYLHGAGGQTLSLIGGDITLTNATVYAPAGRLNVAAVGSAGEVIPTDTDLVMQGFGRLGTLTMARDPDAPRKMVDMGNGFADVPLGDLDTSGAGGGALFIRGGEWVSWGGMVFADTYGAQAGRDVNVQIAGGMRLTNGALLTAATLSQGDAGDVNLTIADTLTVQNGGEISASTFGTGPAGDVTVNARNLLVDGMGSEFFTGLASSTYDSTGAGGSVSLTLADTLTVQNGGEISASTFGTGPAGDVTVNARNLLVDGMGYDGFTGVGSYAVSNGEGGRVNLTLVDTLTVQNGGQIHAITFGTGDTGDMTVNARNLLVDGMGSENFTGLLSSTYDSTGAGGSVNLTLADTLTVQNGGQIHAITFGTGDAGDMTVNARNLLVDGMGIDTGLLSSVAPDSTGAGGSVNLTLADTLTVQNGGQIRASTFGTGPAGDVTVNARNLLVDRMGAETVTGLVSNANSGSTGAGGSVNLTLTDTLTVQNGGRISASTWGEGPAGDVTVNARNLLVDGMGYDGFTGLASSAGDGSTGAGGSVNLTLTDTLTVQNGGEISAGTFSKGNAGDVTVSASNLLVDGMGHEGFTGIDSQTNPTALSDGGNVTVSVADTLTVKNDGRISVRSFSGEGNAGELKVNAPYLTLTDGGSIVATASDTTGGNVTIDADYLKLLNGSAISSSAFGDVFGSDGGNVTIHSINIVALNGSTVTARAEEFQGGRIRIEAQTFLYDAPTVDGVLSATGGHSGNDGTVEVNAPNIDISGSLANLNPAYLDVAHHVNPRCFVGDRDERSHFLIHGRGTLPLGPDEAIPAPVSRCLPAEPVALASSAADVPTERPSPAPVAQPPAAVLGFNNR